MDALATATERKHSRLESYRRASKSVWLFLLDDSYPGAIAQMLSRTDCESAMSELCSQDASSDLERTFLCDWKNPPWDLRMLDPKGGER
jgi:hypothetical protein